MSPRFAVPLVALLYSGQLLACLLGPGYLPFASEVPARNDLALLPAPNVQVSTLRRANLAASHSLRDIAFLSLSVPDATVGYRFTRVEGFLGFPLPDGFVAPAASGTLEFTWVETVHTAGLPIAAFVEVTAMTHDGRLSEPQRLWIENSIE